MSIPSIVKTTVANNSLAIAEAIERLEAQGLKVVSTIPIGTEEVQITAKNMSAANRPGLELTN